MRSPVVVLHRVAALVSVTLLGATLGLAEDIKGKFYVGGAFGYLVTTDNVRSNAALLIAPLGNDGAPFTGDQGERIACDPSDATVFCDPRPDDLISRQMQLQQTYKLDGTVGYGLTSNFALQLDVGYYKGRVSNFDVFTEMVRPTSISPLDPCIVNYPNQDLNPFGRNEPCDLTLAKDVTVKNPISPASVTEMPVMINGLLRFRKDSNFNPYIGVGAGYLFTKLDEDPSVGRLNDRLSRLHIISTTDEFGPNYGRLIGSQDPDGNAPFISPVQIDINEGFQWQAVGGVEYFFNDRLSLSFDARYVLSNHAISVLMNGEDQIDIQTFSEPAFRNDGTVEVITNRNVAPNPIIDPNSSNGVRYICDTNGDFIKDQPPAQYVPGGPPEKCYSGPVDLKETIVVQGGRIRLSAFHFAFGFRWHF